MGLCDRRFGPSWRHPTNDCRRIVPSSSQASPTIWGDQCGLNGRDWHTQPRRDHCSQEGRTTIGTCCVPGARHRDGVDMPDAGLHPHREAMHKQHTEPRPSCCVPFGDPHVHKVTPSDETKQECIHSNANTLGPAHHLARTHQTDDKSKERKRRGYIN